VVRAVSVALAVGMVGVSAAGASSGGRSGGRAIKTWKQTFVDGSRPTEAGSATPELPTRTLVTNIYRPVGKGPWPLIVFSHGLDGHPDKFTELNTAWAEAGYVVAAPAFPLTNNTVPGDGDNAAGVAEQPADVTFLISQLLQENKSPGSRLHKAIDPKRIGAGGLSLGGATTYGVTFNECCADSRIKAAEVLDGIILGVGDGTGKTQLDGHVPLLIVHSDTDPALPYASAQAAYAQAKAPVWFVTLHDASHASQFENDPTPYDQIGIDVTTDFWDATLKGQKRAFTKLERDATVEGLSSVESRR
jgi:predicted dienelactone hydrolase